MFQCLFYSAITKQLFQLDFKQNVLDNKEEKTKKQKLIKSDKVGQVQHEQPKTAENNPLFFRLSFYISLITTIFIFVLVVVVLKIGANTNIHVLRKTFKTNYGKFGASQLKKLVKRNNPSWKAATIKGAITLFVGIFSVTTAMYVNGCGATLTDAMHMTKGSSTQDNLAACVIAGTALALSAYAGITVSAYGIAAGWIYDSSSSTVSKRDFIPPKDGTFMQHLGGSVYLEHPDQHNSDILGFIRAQASQYEEHLRFSGRLFSNQTGSLDHVGYSFIVGSENYNHTVITDTKGHIDAIETLGRFDGETYTPSNHIKFVNDTNLVNDTNFVKRDETGFWLSYTNWGLNTGYEEDLLEWNEYETFAQEYSYGDGFGTINQIQPCTNSVQCYSVQSKFCAGIGFSPDMGKEDAEVGEVYVEAYGGLDMDCASG